MLRDGEFIREEPPRIGIQYIPQHKATGLNNFSKEDQFAQDILLGNVNKQQSFLSKVLGFMLRL